MTPYKNKVQLLYVKDQIQDFNTYKDFKIIESE